MQGLRHLRARMSKKLIEMNGEKINVKGYSPAYAARPEDCIACGNCAITCPDSIISVYRID